jgi:hypothetical protein
MNVTLTFIKYDFFRKNAKGKAYNPACEKVQVQTILMGSGSYSFSVVMRNLREYRNAGQIYLINSEGSVTNHI